MARGNRRAKRGGFLSGLFGLINPIRDPSLLIAVILTVIWQGSTPQEWWRWALFGLLNWIAVKARTAFSDPVRKGRVRRRRSG